MRSMRIIIQFNSCCACVYRRPLILFTELSVLPGFFLCIVVCILCSTILFDKVLLDVHVEFPYNGSVVQDIEPSHETCT